MDTASAQIPPGLSFDPTTQQYGYSYWPFGAESGFDPSLFGTPPPGYQFAYATTDGQLTTTPTTTTTADYSSLLSYYSTEALQGGLGGLQGLVPPPGYQFATLGPDGSLIPVAPPAPGPVCLFVLHLPSHYRDDDLYQLFKDYGTIVTCKVMIDPSTAQSKGYGFVNMSTYMEAQAAIAGLNGYHCPSTNKYLKVSFKTSGPGAKKDDPFG